MKILDKKLYFNENFFETIDSEEKAYWLGFIAADGNLSSKRPLFRLTLAEKDLNHIIKLKMCLNSKKTPFKIKNTSSYRITHYSKKMYNDLVNKGITPRKSLTLLPSRDISEDLIRHWVRGYFDGDGSVFIHKEDNMIRFNIIGTKDVLEFILKGSNIGLNIREVKNVYKIQSSSKKALSFLSYIYDNSTVYLDRKKLIYRNYLFNHQT